MIALVGIFLEGSDSILPVPTTQIEDQRNNSSPVLAEVRVRIAGKTSKEKTRDGHWVIIRAI